MERTLKFKTDKATDWEYKTCDRCCYDIVDSEGDIMEHVCTYEIEFTNQLKNY